MKLSPSTILLLACIGCSGLLLEANLVKGQAVPFDSVATSPDQWLTIDKIFVIGNKRTKEKIILRELDLTEGQTISQEALEEILIVDRRKLFNTQLFLDVNISQVRLDDHFVDIIIRVAERWYTIPSPFFRLADRNFNVWFSTENRDWRRVEYGLKFFQYNFRGLNERLYFYTQLGFTRQFALRYVIPYIDKAQKNGIEVAFSYSEKKNINYITRDHQFIFTDSLDEGIRNYRGTIGWRFRPSFYNNHYVDLRYNDVWVSDTITALNPNYFLHDGNRQQYFSLAYSFISDHRDYIGYPLKGYRWEVGMEKLGLGLFSDINLIRIDGSYRKYTELGKGFYLANSIQGYGSAPRRQPYANFIGIGYNRVWLRGHELDVIEGQAFVIQQNTLSKRIFSREIDLRKIFSIEQFNTIPISFYLKGYVDHGYVHNSLPYPQNSRLANRYLMGYGVGLDFVSFYDFVLRIERSWRFHGEPGFYFHLNTAF